MTPPSETRGTVTPTGLLLAAVMMLGAWWAPLVTGTATASAQSPAAPKADAAGGDQDTTAQSTPSERQPDELTRLLQADRYDEVVAHAPVGQVPHQVLPIRRRMVALRLCWCV